MSRRRPPAIPEVVVAACLMAATVAGAEVYRWVDGNGQAHFSTSPPPGGKAQRLELHPSTPDPVSPPAGRSWQEQLLQSGERRHQEQQRQRQEQAQARKAQESDYKCQSARRSLDLLQRDRPVYRVNAQGEREYVDDAQRPADIEAARQRVDRDCR